MWHWLREGRAVVIGVLGAFLLILYGVVPTLQPAHFGRVYAAYGGVFVVLSLLWGWRVDGHRPDVPEIAGSTLCLVGVAVIMYWPRSGYTPLRRERAGRSVPRPGAMRIAHSAQRVTSA